MPKVVAFRESFLRPTETFVRDHLLGLPSWAPEVVTTGIRQDSLTVDGVPVHIARRVGLSGRLAWRAAKLVRRPSGPVLAPAVRRAIESVRPDLVHAHFGPDIAFADLALRGTPYPLIGTFHGYDASVRPDVLASFGWSAKRLAEQGPRLLNRLAAIITVSGRLRDSLIDRGAPVDRIHVIPCGVRSTEFAWSPPPASGPVLFVGRLVEKRAVPTSSARWLESPTHPAP